MRVVFCWEMGSNYGHIAGFLPIYHELVRQGAEVFCILRERRFAYLLGEKMQARCFQAPSPKCKAEKKILYSYADILAYVGYLQESVLTRYIADWSSLLAQLQPDFVIADHAPTALLASRALQIPASSIGTGFTNPPAENEFPYFFPERPSPHGYIDKEILNVVNASLKNLRKPGLSKLGDIFLSSTVYLNTFAELDHYGTRANAHYWGPLFNSHIGDIIHWPTQIEPKIFAYLTPQIPNLRLVLHEIAKLPGYKLLHIPGVDSHTFFDTPPTGLQIHSTPVNLDSVLTGVDLVINQGGMGLSSQCFLRGVPQVIIPTQIEQRMLARRMLVQKFAFAVDPQKENPPYEKIFNSALQSPQNQKIMLNEYKNFSLQQQIEKLVSEWIKII